MNTNVITAKLGTVLNKLFDESGGTPNARKDIYVALAHHLAQEYAFIMLETPTTAAELHANFDASFEDGLRCAARHHAHVCKSEACAALAALKTTIRHSPRLKAP